ncbi:MAG: PQQ-binding-like beta-propeller repeat protein [Armatimonadetes bacterium]|nr:PQQ-binding-like beta-propeller repeat protein [Armatimonadota bacterium]
MVRARLALMVLVSVVAVWAQDEPPVELMWKHSAPGGFYAAPAVVGNTVYAAALDQHVYALAADSGKVLWDYPAGGKFYAGVTVADGLAFCASTDKILTALDARTGHVKWQHTLDGLPYAAPAVGGGLVFQGNGETGTLRALVSSSGQLKWSYQLGARMGSGMALADGRLFVGSHDRKLYVLDAATGKLAWTFTTDGIVDSMPLVAGERVYVKLPNDTTYCLAVADGKQIWKYTSPQPPVPADQVSNWSTLVLSRGLLLFGSIDYRLYALDAATGERRWQRDAPDAWPSAPTPLGRLGVAGNKDGSLNFVDLRSGEIKSRWTTPQPGSDQYLRGIMWPPVVVGERLYAGCMDGNLYAVKLRSRDGGPVSRLTSRSLSAAKVALHDLPDANVEAYKISLALDAPEDAPAAATVGLVFDADDKGASHVLSLAGGTAKLSRAEPGGAETLLAQGKVETMPAQVTIDRSGRRLRLLADDRVVLSAWDDLPPGKVAAGTSDAGLDLIESKVQPVEALYFDDDFMRVRGGQGDWQTRSGKWAASGVSEENVEDPGKRPQATFSANPFAYRASDVKGEALATAGQWFWDSYRAEVSARPGPAQGKDAAIGVAGYLRDDRNYLAFEWAWGPGNVRRLVAHVNGQRQVLAEAPGSWRADQWYRLGLELGDGRLTAFVDGEPVLSAACDLYGQGQVGLYARSVAFADFDDVQVAGLDGLRDRFDRLTPGLWRAVAGEWGFDLGAKGPDGQGIKFIKAGTEGLALTGSADWSAYEVSSQVRAGDGGVGLVLCSADADHGLQVRWADRLRLVKVDGPNVKVLAEAPLPARRDRWSKLSASSRGGFVTVRVDGESVVEAFEPSQESGKAGLWGQRGAMFAGCTVTPMPQVHEVEFSPEVAPQFSQEELMAQWARPEGSWWLDEHDREDGNLWYRSDVHGPVELVVDAKRVWNDRQRKLRLTIGGERRKPDTGYNLLIEQDNDKRRQVQLSIRRGDQEVAKAAGSLQDVNLLRFVRRGRSLVAMADNAALLTWQEPGQPLDGPQVALRSSEARFDLARVQVAAEQCFDTTFVRAPWEWWQAKGVWETTNRWKCDPRWSFFGGFGDRNPTIWTKQAFGGDVQVDAYMGIKMDSRQGEHYFHPSDLSVTLCGDGQQVNSGYAFLFAGRNNTASLLYKNGKLMAENKTDDGRFRYTSDAGNGLTEFHRHWFHLSVRKAGGRILCQLDDRTVFDVADPNPIDSGHVAIYAVNNTLNVTRARITYEHLAEPAKLPDTGAMLAAADDGDEVKEDWRNDFEVGLGGVAAVDNAQHVLCTRTREAAEGRYALQMTNLVSGGTFLVKLAKWSFVAKEHPLLTFRYRIPANVRTNLYADLGGGAVGVLRLTGGEEAAPGQVMLGQVEGITADNRWHEAKIDLSQVLQKAGRSDDLRIMRLMAGNLEPDPYVNAGFQGNPVGATWYLDDLAIGAR